MMRPFSFFKQQTVIFSTTFHLKIMTLYTFSPDNLKMPAGQLNVDIVEQKNIY